MRREEKSGKRIDYEKEYGNKSPTTICYWFLLDLYNEINITPI